MSLQLYLCLSIQQCLYCNLDNRMKQRLLTAGLQSVGGGRRAAAGMFGAAAQTAGTKTRYPAGAHMLD